MEPNSWHIKYLSVKVGDWVYHEERFVPTLNEELMLLGFDSLGVGRFLVHASSQKNPGQWAIGYEVRATDGYLGVLEDFVLEHACWHINYLTVKIGDWVYSREQLISTLWVDVILWANHRVVLNCGRNIA